MSNIVVKALISPLSTIAMMLGLSQVVREEAAWAVFDLVLCRCAGST